MDVYFKTRLGSKGQAIFSCAMLPGNTMKHSKAHEQASPVFQECLEDCLEGLRIVDVGVVVFYKGQKISINGIATSATMASSSRPIRQ